MRVVVTGFVESDNGRKFAERCVNALPVYPVPVNPLFCSPGSQPASSQQRSHRQCCHQCQTALTLSRRLCTRSTWQPGYRYVAARFASLLIPATAMAIATLGSSVSSVSVDYCSPSFQTSLPRHFLCLIGRSHCACQAHSARQCLGRDCY